MARKRDKRCSPASPATAKKNSLAAAMKSTSDWIAICDRKVVAHGEDRDQVLREASQVTGRSEDDIAVWVMASPFFMLQDNPKDDLGL